MNINPAYKASELRYALEKVGVRALVVAKSFRNQNLLDILTQLIPQLENENQQHFTDKGIISSALIPSLERVIVLSDKPQKRSTLLINQLSRDTNCVESHSGALRWQDLMDLASPNLIAKVHNLQRDIQIDEAANIQFTSVNAILARLLLHLL